MIAKTPVGAAVANRQMLICRSPAAAID